MCNGKGSMQHSALSERRFKHGSDCRSGSHSRIGCIGVMGASRHFEAIVSLAYILSLSCFKSSDHISEPMPQASKPVS
jgi:hypothetical protein